MTNGSSLMYAVGSADSARNMGQFYFVYSSAGSTSNRLSMGLHSVDDVFNILGSGNVGIGTTSPSKKLTVAYTAGSDGLTVTGSLRQISTFEASGEHSWVYINSAHSNTYFPQLALQRNSTTLGTVQLQRASNSDTLGAYVESEMLVGTSTNTPMSLQTNGVRRLVVSGSSVGINTRTPIGVFEVQGTSGSLFSVTDTLTGVVFSANDISGISILKATAGSTNYVDVTGELRATSEITAYYSDERLKTKVGTFTDPLSIVRSLNGFKYVGNETAKRFGYFKDTVQIGLSAQEVQAVVPEIVKLAPFDMTTSETGEVKSLTGENYLTVDYSKLVPVLIEAIKQLEEKVNRLEGR
jgi:hypothetical protein